MNFVPDALVPSLRRMEPLVYWEQDFKQTVFRLIVNNNSLNIKNKSVNICVGHNETTNEAVIKMGK